MTVAPEKITSLVAGISTDIADAQLTTQTLKAAMSATFEGSDASGAWSWRMAYDVMEAAFVRTLIAQTPEDVPASELRRLMHLAQRLPTQSRRSENQIRLQQFSTPLPYAYLAAQAAMIRAHDHVLEPSAGTGALLLAAQRAGAALSFNEVDRFRAALLCTNFHKPASCHDAEHIDDLLDPAISPTVIVMNPPFSSTVKRAGDSTIAARHVIAAAKRLAPGGRLVAIMPMGFTGKTQRPWFDKLASIAQPLLSIALPGAVYRKNGTNVETQLIIADKTNEASAFKEIEAKDLPDALAHVTAHVPPRREAQTILRSARKTAPIHKRAKQQPSTSSGAQGSHAPREITYQINDVPLKNAPVSPIYAAYRPQRIKIDGAQPHPTPLVESIAMASVVPPAPGATLRLPDKIVSEGLLSETQLETVIMANDAHARDLPGKFIVDEQDATVMRNDEDPSARAYRQGFYIGDNTGVGKGRSVSAIILENWLAGRRKAIWFSKSATLIEDAIRDWRDLGGSPTDIQSLSKWKPEQDITMGHGILFVTYATLRSQGKDGTTRLQQIIDWVGPEFEGVIGFDEAHAMANAMASSEGRGTKASQQGIAGLRLQYALPRARITYVSATGATKVSNLAYATRLGLWGSGAEYPFASREQFIASMEAGGVAAMEVVARDLKAMGLYVARALSFEGVEYDILEHALTEAQIGIYNTYAAAFKTIHKNLNKALEATGVVDPDGGIQSSSAKASAMSTYESTKQRFFAHLLLGMKAPAVIDAIDQDLKDGWAPVIQIVSTGEALLKRRVEAMDLGDTLVEGALTPREYVVTYLERAFPVTAHELIEVDGEIIAQPLRDEHGDLVISQEACDLRDAVIEDLMCLAPIPSALDQLIWHFGEERVAEVTGRSLRPVKDVSGQLHIHKRNASANSAETAAFMNGDKDLLIFSDAGGTGRSYHAAASAKNQKRRRHYLLEPGWRADNAIQGLGRSHRSAQVSAPWFRVCTTNVHGEKRFTSTISARLDTLGALSKGQRETGTQGMFREEDNLMSPIARAALRGLYADIARDHAQTMSYAAFTDWTALKLTDQDGHMLEDLPPIQRFLNRVLALPIDLQNGIFSEFMERISLQTERAKAAGTFDRGIETLRGDPILEVSREDLWTCPKTAATTEIIGLDVTRPVRRMDSKDALAECEWGYVPMINAASGKAAIISKRPLEIYEDDTTLFMRRIQRPRERAMIAERDFQHSKWEKVSPARFKTIWDAEVSALPTTETKRLFLLTGLLLPIWTKIPSHNERIYRVTPTDGQAMIGRSLNEDQAAMLRARFMSETPTTPEEMLTLALGSTNRIDLGHGLHLSRRRVAGEMRLEIEGADRTTIAQLKLQGCFTEIIAFQLRVFMPHGDGVDTLSILKKVLGQDQKQRGEAA